MNGLMVIYLKLFKVFYLSLLTIDVDFGCHQWFCEYTFIVSLFRTMYNAQANHTYLNAKQKP